jgi:tRNA (adenine57-N1/adenine58-N1)-methyltransferase
MPIDDLSALLWDMDGTLVDTEPLWVECEADLMRQFGYEWGEDDARYCIGGPMEKVERYMSEKSESNHPQSWFGNQLISMMLERLNKGVPLMPGVNEILSEARALGLKLALVSASRREVVSVSVLESRVEH